MADTKRSALTALTGVNLAGGDLIALTDVSDTTMAASGTDKSMTVDELRIGLDTPIYVVKSADQSNNSNTTLADVTDMSWSVVAGGEYVFEFYLWHVSAATTTGLVVSMNGPTIGAGVLLYMYHGITSVTGTFHGGSAVYEQVQVNTGTPSTTVPFMSTVHGYLLNGATGGTLQLRMRSEISASNATIKQGSWGRLVRLN